MDLRKYNPESVLKPVGFVNLGFTCYYNSLLQALLSCTSFIDELLDNDYEYSQNKICNIYIKLINDILDDKSESDIARLSPLSWNTIIKEISDQSPEMAKFAMGQQCVGEGFSILLQVLEKYQGIQNLFLHRRKNRLYCRNCNTWCSETIEINNFFSIEPDLELKQLKKFSSYSDPKTKNDLNSFLFLQDTFVDKDHICGNCNYRGEKFKISQLTMVPEILFVLSKKYMYENNKGKKLDVYTDFPKILSFNSKNNIELTYQAVSQIEHSGGIDGGHYWTICKRNDGWYKLNDMSISSSEFKPTNNTYDVVYHIM